MQIQGGGQAQNQNVRQNKGKAVALQQHECRLASATGFKLNPPLLNLKLFWRQEK